MNPLVGYGGVGGNSMAGGFGGYGLPQMMPQVPISPMGSNCCSLSIQVPSAAPQMPYPIPCPPPMIQPMMPQMSMPYSPQMSPMMPQPVQFLPQFPGVQQQQQPIYPPNFPGGFNGLPGVQSYGGFNQGTPPYANLGNYSGFPNIGSNMIANPSGISQPAYPQPGLAGYGSFGSNSNYSVGFGQQGYPQPGLAGYGGYGFGGANQSPYNGYGNCGQQFVGGYNPQGYNAFGNLPNSNFIQPGVGINMPQTPYGIGEPGLASYGPPIGVPNQSGYNGYIPQPYGAFQQPPYGSYGQQLPYGNYGQQLPYGNYGQQLPYGSYGMPLLQYYIE
ncbi:hypothetical protein I4U23_007673 [Adineta vaga]|nr:hypothetical protein I4U23_007673 [Adineta vaga]